MISLGGGRPHHLSTGTHRIIPLHVFLFQRLQGLSVVGFFFFFFYIKPSHHIVQWVRGAYSGLHNEPNVCAGNETNRHPIFSVRCVSYASVRWGWSGENINSKGALYKSLYTAQF